MVEHKSIETPLKRAKALGSSHHGAGVWWAERLTSVALVPLTIWFLVSIISLLHSDHSQLMTFFGNPINAVLMALLILIAFQHTVLGLQVVVEDYVHAKLKKLILLMIIKLGYLALGVATIFAIIRLHFNA